MSGHLPAPPSLVSLTIDAVATAEEEEADAATVQEDLGVEADDEASGDRLKAGYWPVGLRSSAHADSVYSDSDCSKKKKKKCVEKLSCDAISDKVRKAMESLSGYDYLHKEVDRMSNESFVSMVAGVFASPFGRDEKSILRRRKAELEEDLILTRDRLLLTAEDVVNLRGKVAMVQAENKKLKKQLSQLSQTKNKQGRQVGGKGQEKKKKQAESEPAPPPPPPPPPPPAESKKSNHNPCDYLTLCFYKCIFCGKSEHKTDNAQQPQNHPPPPA